MQFSVLCIKETSTLIHSPNKTPQYHPQHILFRLCFEIMIQKTVIDFQTNLSKRTKIFSLVCKMEFIHIFFGLTVKYAGTIAIAVVFMYVYPFVFQYFRFLRERFRDFCEVLDLNYNTMLGHVCHLSFCFKYNCENKLINRKKNSLLHTSYDLSFNKLVSLRIFQKSAFC